MTTPVRASTPLDEAGLGILVSDFEALYERKYGKGSAYRGAGIEMTLFRLSARGRMTRPEIPVEPLAGEDASAAHRGKRDVFVEAEGGFAPADIYDFASLASGNSIAGPAIIHTPITTIVVQAAQTARMDPWRNIVIAFD